MRRAALLAVLLIVTAPLAKAQDAYTIVPQKQDVIHESEWLRVRRVTYQPGEKVPMHEHKQRIVVFLTDGTVRSIAPDGKTQDTPFRGGLVNWSEPIKHALENVGSTPLEAVEVELLGPHPTAPQAYTGDPLKQDPQHFKLEFENDRVRVYRFRLGPHETSPMHDHLDRVTVHLTGAHVRVTLPDGSTQGLTEKGGNASFRASARHAAENMGAEGYELLTIEFKSPKKAGAQ
jgi:quercetin dioxygenase-like cupin family protein